MTNWFKMSGNMPKIQAISGSDIGWIASSAIRLPPPPFLSGCLVWRWLRISGCHAAISARASRSRMAALRGVLWRAVQVRAWQSFFCSFTTQSAPQRLKLLCSVMDNTQIHTKITQTDSCTRTQCGAFCACPPGHIQTTYVHTLSGKHTWTQHHFLPILK